MNPPTVNVRASIAKYDELHEKLWARSRDAVVKRNRIDAAEGRLVEAASNEEERQYNLRLYTLRKRALDFNIKELAIEISHVSDVIESLKRVQAAQDTGARGDVEETKLPSLSYERYEEWAGSSHELYALRSQALDVASEIMRMRSQPPKSPERAEPNENDLSVALGRMRAHTRTSCTGGDEVDGPANLQQQASSVNEWWKHLLSTNTQHSSQQTYLRALFNTNSHVHTFESRKILEYVEECEKFSSLVLGRREVISFSGLARLTPRPSLTGDARKADPPLGIEPKRFHEFMDALTYYIVEQQRELHNEEWDEEEVQLILEEHVMSSVRSLAKAYTDRSAEDTTLKEKCDQLSSATQEQLGVQKEFTSDELVPYCEAIALLRSMFFSLTPSKKLFCVASAANTIFQQLQLRGVDLRKVGADVFMDIWVYVIVKANIPDLISSMAFMSEYAVRSLSTGQAGYFLASLQVATSAILRMDAADVIKSVDNIGAFVVCQREKYLKLSRQATGHFEILTPSQTLVGYRMCAVKEWLLNSTRFYSIVLRHTPDDPSALVNVAVVRLNMEKLTPPQVEFLEKVLLPADQAGVYVQDTPLGKAVCLTDDAPLTAYDLDCHDYDQVEQSLLDSLALERLGIGLDESDGAARSSLTLSNCSSLSDDVSTASSERSTLSEGSADTAKPSRKHFSPALVDKLEIRLHEEYAVSDTLCLHDSVVSLVSAVQTVCQHLEYLSSLANVDGVYSDLVYAAVKSFKVAHKAANTDNVKCTMWSDDGVLTPQVFAAMKATLSNYLADLAHLGFLLPYGLDCCDPGERARSQVRQLITSCQRGWHLPIHVHGSLGKKTRDEIQRRMAMLNSLRSQVAKKK